VSLPGARYQVVLVGPQRQAPKSRAALRATLRERVSELKLEHETYLRIIEPQDASELAAQVDFRAPLAAVYFGGPLQTPEATAVVEALLKRAVFVLPVLTAPGGNRQQLPKVLHSIQVMPLSQQGPRLEGVAGRVLEELRLLSIHRAAFISYCKAEARGVADQLYHALVQRSFDVFLDTCSLRSGEPWREAIWDHILGADVFVLLDTPGALDKKWIKRELTRAQVLGTGVLQVLWPGHSRRPETEWCTLSALAAEDLAAERSGDGADYLSEEALARTLMAVESLRARSLAAKRARVIAEVCKKVADKGWTYQVQSPTRIDICHPRAPDRKPTRLFTVTGHPGSIDVQRVHDQGEAGSGGLIYDSYGMLDTRATHLRWLNQYLPLRLLPAQEVDTWLARLK
jgi:hypothetical protein